MKHFISIRTKIFLSIFTFMTIPIIILTYLSNQISIKSLLEQTKINDLQIINCMQQSTDTLLDSIENLSSLIASDKKIIEFLEDYYEIPSVSPDTPYNLDFSDLSSYYLKHSEKLLGMSLVDTEYSFLGETTFDSHQLMWFFNDGLFREVADSSHYWTAPHMLVKSSNQTVFWSISCITPIKKNNTILGYLILYMNKSCIDQITEELSDTVYIINDSEATTYSTNTRQECYIISDKTCSSNEFDPYTANFYYKSKINYNYLINNSSIITSINGNDMTVTSQKYPRMGWVYLIVSPYTEISQQVHSHLSQIVVMGVASVIFALISSYMISRNISRPIYFLNRTIKKVSAGNLDIRHHEITNDEIGTLAQAFNSLLDKIQELMRNISEQQIIKRKLQLQLIQAQVKPHFLYNVLEMISSFIRDHLDSYALESISHLASFYRTSLSDGSDIISIKKEICMIEDYLTLQHLRYIEFMDFSLNIDDDILCYEIPKLTLQPLVENAIYHGLKVKCAKGILKITGYQQNDRIFFEIYDNGIGMNNDMITSIMNSLNQETLTKDFGISSVVKRLNIHFNNKATIQIQSEEGQYTNFVVSFPAKK